MRYLYPSDYKSVITEYDFETLGFRDPNESLFIHDAEIKAQENISLYLRKRYDLVVLFRTYPEYKDGSTYGTGDTIWYGSGFSAYLYSPTANTNSIPTGNSWNLFESRYPLIVQWMVNLSLYFLHKRILPDNIPTHRVTGYQEAMMSLNGIQEGKLSLDFPELSNRNYNIVISGKTSNGIEYLW